MAGSRESRESREFQADYPRIPDYLVWLLQSLKFRLRELVPEGFIRAESMRFGPGVGSV